MSAAADFRGIGGAYVRHPVSGKFFLAGSTEAEKIVVGEIHPIRMRAETAERNRENATSASSSKAKRRRGGVKGQRPPRKKRRRS